MSCLVHCIAFGVAVESCVYGRSVKALGNCVQWHGVLRMQQPASNGGASSSLDPWEIAKQLAQGQAAARITGGVSAS